MRRKLLVASACFALAACNQLSQYKAAEDAVKQKLRDPESARFSGESKCGGSEIVLGRVNSKNGFGGYAGDERFVSDGTTAALISDVSSDEFVNLMNRCTAAVNAYTKALESSANKTS